MDSHYIFHYMQNQLCSSYASRLAQQKYCFEQLLNCQICYCRASQPTMCPHCSKLYCEACISKSLHIKTECPNCRKTIKGQLTNCTRFMNELTSIVMNLIQSGEEAEKCIVHGVSLNYFCENCRVPACCQCKMFGQHASHTFQQISRVYEEKYERIKDLLGELRSIIFDEERNICEIENIFIKVRNSTETYLGQIDEQTQKVKSKIAIEKSSESESKNRIEFALKNQIKQIKKLKKQLILSSQSACRLNCYKNNEQLEEKISKSLQISKDLMTMNENTNALTEALPPFKKFTFKVNSYNTVKNQSHAIQSELYEYECSVWRLNVYIRGNNKDGQYLSVFLEMVKNPDNLKRYDYQMELIHPKNKSYNIVRQHQAKFEETECWGFGRFVKNSQIMSKQFISKDHDTLEFIVSIKLPQYCDLYKRRNFIFGHYQRELQEKTEFLNSLEEKEIQPSLFKINQL